MGFPQNRRTGSKIQQKLTKITKIFPLGFFRLLLFKINSGFRAGVSKEGPEN